MPTTTVRDVADLLAAIIPDLRDPVRLPSKLPLFNAAVVATWRVLVNRQTQHNWFVVSSESTDPTLPNYFPKLEPGQREYPLPQNFHQLRAIEVLTQAFRDVVFTKANLDRSGFIADRASPEQVQTSGFMYYDIIGANPGSFLVSKSPSTEIDAMLRYVRKPDKITSLDSSLDDFPVDVVPSMAEYLAKANTLGMQDGRFTAFVGEWSAAVDDLVFGERRDNTDRQVVVGMFEDWF